ncbi:hypothetical protein [Flavivirga eckloniae]|uniref:Uncharacterized protein n=1 Tax=Flavivirga eckloniae TaxID=1803846 RepID=A0A2K9PSD9_9FLAO|nr:hypothetical protein [Flavivirga eckloniae]AUP79971.1 hypothetical protein C1H87_15175 [Flavivirga eckloniae]
MKYCLPLLFLTSIYFSFSQTKSSTETYYKLFDSHFDYKNHEVFNGLEYVDVFPELSRTKETNNKFYGSFGFKKGFIIYDEQPYYDLEMKYDLLNDCVLLNYVSKKTNYLRLSPERVSQFKLKEHKFVRLQNSPSLHAIYENGFFKEGYKGGKFSLYIKYRKDRQEDLSEGMVVNVFKEHKTFIVHHKDVFHEIGSRKDMLKAFSFRGKEIRTFYKNNSRVLKSNKEQFFVRLVKYLDTMNYLNTDG